MTGLFEYLGITGPGRSILDGQPQFEYVPPPQLSTADPHYDPSKPLPTQRQLAFQGVMSGSPDIGTTMATGFGDGGVIAATRAAATKAALAAARDANPMVAHHNTRVDKLEEMARGGGVAVAPSIGVSRAVDPVTSFGDVSLIAPPSLIDPRSTPVYARDAYTPRYPDVRYDWVPKDERKILDFVGMQRHPSFENSYNMKPGTNVAAVPELLLNKDGNRLLQVPQMAAHYLQRQGMDPAQLLGSIDNHRAASNALEIAIDRMPDAGQGFINWSTREMPRQLGVAPRERLAVERGGDLKYIPHTPGAALGEMKRSPWRGGEQFITDNWLLGQLAPQFKNHAELAAARDRLVDRGDPALKGWNAEMDYINRGWGKAGQGGHYNDQWLMDLASAYPRGRAGLEALNAKNYGGRVPDELLDRTQVALDRGRDLGTTYFEAKPRRNIPLHAFVGAVAPEAQASAVEKILRKGNAYLPVIPYGPHERPEAFKGFSQHFFTPAALSILGGGTAARGLLPDDEG